MLPSAVHAFQYFPVLSCHPVRPQFVQLGPTKGNLLHRALLQLWTFWHFSTYFVTSSFLVLSIIIYINKNYKLLHAYYYDTEQWELKNFEALEVTKFVQSPNHVIMVELQFMAKSNWSCSYTTPLYLLCHHHLSLSLVIVLMATVVTRKITNWS